MKLWTGLHWIVLALLMILWSAAGSYAVYEYCRNHMEYFGWALTTTLLTALFIVALHGLILVPFSSRQAVWGMLLGKLLALPMTLGFGLAVIIFGEFGRAGGEVVGAKWAYSSVPTGMAMTAFASFVCAVVGAAVGHAASKRNNRDQPNQA